VARTYDELLQEQATAAVQVLGAHHTSWNRTVEMLPLDDPRSGLVTWDHTIKLHPDRVVKDLREMFDTAGQQHDESTLRRYREALRVLLHENVHLLAAAGTSHGMGADAYQEPAKEILEEATTEIATQQNLNEYIKALDLEAVAPGISRERTEPAYGEYVPAVETFAEEIGDASGHSGREVIRQMAVVNAENKFSVAAGLLYDQKLASLAPAQAREGSVQAIAEAMQPAFAAIHGFDPDDPQDIQMSELAGLMAARAGGKKADELTKYWQANQDLRRSIDAGLSASTPLRGPQTPGHGAAPGRSESPDRDGRRPEAGSARPASHRTRGD